MSNETYDERPFLQIPLPAHAGPDIEEYFRQKQKEEEDSKKEKPDSVIIIDI
tara:strand:+ start:1475 stop:1630 length:156 start_codon:yes stop_codon:yes gene_type:complete